MANANILLNGLQPTQALPQAAGNALQLQNALFQMQQQPLQNELLRADAEAAKMQNKAGAMRLDAETAKFQLGDAAQDAMMLKPLLAADPARAIQAMDARIQKIAARGGDPSDTKALRDGLVSGQITPQQAMGELDTVIGTAEQFGLLKTPEKDYRGEELALRRDQLNQQKQQFDQELSFREKQLASNLSAGTDKPADQRAAEWYMSLDPEKKAEVDRYRRGDRVTAGNEKIIYETADAAEKARQNAANYTDLATRYEQSDIGSGMFGSNFPEAIKEFTGEQDAYTSMRKNWAAIKASQVVANLPPGAASDADVKLALGGFLPDNANPKQVAAFMRGLSKLENLRADYESFKSDYISENKSTVGINKAWKVYAKQQGLGGPTTSSANQDAPAAGVKFLGFE